MYLSQDESIALTNDATTPFSFQTCARSSRCRLTLSPWSWEARSSSGATRRRASQSQGWAILKLVSPFSFGSPCSSILLWFILSLCNTDGTQPPADWMLSVICNLSALLWQICSFIFCPDRQSSHKKEAFRWWIMSMSIIFTDLLGARRCGGAAGERPKLFAGLGRSPHNCTGMMNKILSRAKLSWRGYMRLVPSDKATNLTILSQ